MFTLSSTIVNSTAVEDNQLVAGAVGAAAILAITTAYYALSSEDNGYEFPKLRGIQLYHAWNFFRRRYDFIHSNLERNLGKSFSFNILHHNVVALTGDDARQVFFSSPHLDFSEGYKILMGAVPRISDVNTITEEMEEVKKSLALKRLNMLLNKTRRQHFLPTLLQDIAGEAEKWGNNSRIDPFTDVFDLVFIMTAHIFACRDLADNRSDLKRIEELLTTLQISATPASLLLRWFPSPARKARKQATTELYTMLYTYVENRRRAEPTSDAIDLLIADGETTQNIVGFVMGVLFAGIISTGNISCWALVDLSIHTEWREKCKNEIRDLLFRHLGDSLSSATLLEKLGAVPISAWEEELPIVEACIRESQRIASSTIALRRNIREDITIGKQVVKRGDFLAYSMTDVHLNPEYYPEPHKYDPGRWLKPDPTPNVVHPFVGWGAGRHPCTGMTMAKLEMKLIMAVFLMGYKFDLVDKDGKFPDHLPVPDRNNIHQVRPLETTYFNIKKVV